MELDAAAYESMNQYLLGALSPEQEAAFQERLKDPIFAQEFALQQQVFQAARYLGREAFREDIRTVAAEMKQSSEEKPPIPFWQTPWMRIAAVVVVLVAVGVTFWLWDPMG